LLQQLVYVILNVPGYHWYFAILDGAVLVNALIAASIVLHYLISRLVPISRFFDGLTIAGAIGILTWSVWTTAVVVSRSDRRRDVRNEVYREAMETIDRETRVAGAIAAVEVGTIGFTTHRRIIDLTALTTPNPEFITPVHMSTFFDAPPALVLTHDPPWHFEV